MTQPRLFADFSVGSVSIGPLVVAAKAKSAPLAFDGQGPLTALLASPGDPLRIPFEWGNYDKDEASSRVSMCLEVPFELKAWVLGVESALVAAASKHSQALFKKDLGEEELRRTFSSAIRSSGGDLLKVKVNRWGPNALRCWSAAGEQAPVPEGVRGSWCAPAVEVKHLWISGNLWGAVWQVTDAVFTTPQVKCPW